MATYNVSEIERIVKDYEDGQNYLIDIDIDIDPVENDIPPLEILRFYQGERNLENGIKLATMFCANKKVVFTKGSIILLEFTPVTGKPLQDYLVKAPYLLDLLCSAVWGILLKKLTPPSDVSASAGGSLL